jgi:hypothetical protein
VPGLPVGGPPVGRCHLVGATVCCAVRGDRPQRLSPQMTGPSQQRRRRRPPPADARTPLLCAAAGCASCVRAGGPLLDVWPWPGHRRPAAGTRQRAVSGWLARGAPAETWLREEPPAKRPVCRWQIVLDVLRAEASGHVREGREVPMAKSVGVEGGRGRHAVENAQQSPLATTNQQPNRMG